MAAARGPQGGTGAAAALPRTRDRRDRVDFSSVRSELNLPVDFPAAVLTEAEQAVARPAVGDRIDATDLPLVTVDPPGAKDLDQAVLVRRRALGYRVHYAIAYRHGLRWIVIS